MVIIGHNAFQTNSNARYELYTILVDFGHALVIFVGPYSQKGVQCVSTVLLTCVVQYFGCGHNGQWKKK